MYLHVGTTSCSSLTWCVSDPMAAVNVVLHNQLQRDHSEAYAERLAEVDTSEVKALVAAVRKGRFGQRAPRTHYPVIPASRYLRFGLPVLVTLLVLAVTPSNPAAVKGLTESTLGLWAIAGVGPKWFALDGEAPCPEVPTDRA